MAAGQGLDAFLARVDAVERAWRALGDAATLDDAAAVAQIIALDVAALESSQLVVRAADLLSERGAQAEERGLLEQGLMIRSPAAPLQLAYARRLRSERDWEAARLWYRGAMLRARPDAGLMLDYAACEQEAGDEGAAARLVDAAISLPIRARADWLAGGKALEALGRRDLAATVFLRALRAGDRSAALRTALTGVATPAILAEPYAPDVPGGPDVALALASLAAHDRLAASFGLPALLRTAEAREADARFLTAERLAEFLADRIARRLPTSWIRLSDGEVRYLLYRKPSLRGSLDEGEAHATAQFMWSIWFGDRLEAVGEDQLAAIEQQFDETVNRADLLGVSSSARLRAEPEHAGYLAALELYISGLPSNEYRLFSDVACNLALNRADPFFGRLLGGLDFLGVIGPHADLAARLQAHLGIGETATYLIPGEGRLARPREAEDRGRHFPRRFDEIMATLTVPRPGAVFLVAGGLLGKIYCDRVRELGGIALDIGALADAWTGHNSRGAPLAGIPALPLLQG